MLQSPMVIKLTTVHENQAKAANAVISVAKSLNIKIVGVTSHLTFLRLEGIEESDREAFIQMCKETVQ